jgi:type I restriction enzyme S subunit
MSDSFAAPLEYWMDSIIDYRGKTPEKTLSGIPLVTAKIIKAGRVEQPNEFIAAEAYEEWMRRGIPNAGDVVITTEAPLGEIAQLPAGKVALAQRVITLRGKPDRVNNTYLKYLLLSSGFQGALAARATGTTVLGIKQSVLRKIELSFPPLTEQKAIAHILGTLDDKIELNRKTNETLEAIAKALFKSWFVDFNPVRAKAEGRPTGLPEDISALFPDSFEDSEIGEVPSGWMVANLKDVTNYLSRGLSPSYCEVGGVVVLNQKCIRDQRVEFSKARFHDSSKKGIDGRTIARFDALVNSTGVGTLGRVAMMHTLNSEIVVDSHVTVVRGKSASESLYISYVLMGRQGEIESLGEGSTGQTELSRSVLGSVSIVMPPPSILQLLYRSVEPIENKKEQLYRQIEILETVRDTLLPKLISGELRIADTEAFLAEAGV